MAALMCFEHMDCRHMHAEGLAVKYRQFTTGERKRRVMWRKQVKKLLNLLILVQ